MGVVRKRGKIWYVDFRHQGRRIVRRVGPSKRQAQDTLRAIERRIKKSEFIAPPELSKVRFYEIADDFLRYAKLNKKPSGYQRDFFSIQHFKAFFGNIQIGRITPGLVERYKEERRKMVTGSTVNRELTCLKTIFAKAVEAEKTPTNPVRKVKMFPDPATRLRFLSRDEARSLVEACDDVMRPIVVLALHTGMRRGEILNLRWADIDLDNRLIWLAETKSGRAEYAPMNDEVVKALKGIKRDVSNPFVFMRGEKEHYRDFGQRFASSLQRAGITDCTFHTLRHTYASHLVMAGVDLATVRELMRHRSYETTLRYAHLAPEHRSDTIRKLREWRER